MKKRGRARARDKRKLWLIVGIAVVVLIIVGLFLSLNGVAFGPPVEIGDPSEQAPDSVGKIKPFVEICTFDELDSIRDDLDGNYRIVCDIDATGETWKPIGTPDEHFTGVIDGLGHKIVGLKSHRTHDNVGFVGVNDGVIRNLRLINVDMAGLDFVGGVSGFNGGRILRVAVNGKVDGNDHVGGVAGTNPGGVIKEVYTNAIVLGFEEVGGVAGRASGRIEDSYSFSNVNGLRSVGGVVGHELGNIDRTFFVGSLGNSDADNDNVDFGGVVGKKSLFGSVKNSYFDIERAGGFDNGYGEGKTQPEMTTPNTYVGWDFDNTWDFNYVWEGYPWLKVEGGKSRVMETMFNHSVSISADKQAFPSVLADGQIEGTGATYWQSVSGVGVNEANQPRLVLAQQPTSDDDPVTGLEIPGRLYSSMIWFDNAVDLSDPVFVGKKIEIMGRTFFFEEGTSNDLIRLRGYDKLKLVDESPVLRGVNEEVIEGTFVKIVKDGQGNVDHIEIDVRAPNGDNDALLEKQVFVDPVFGSFGAELRDLAYSTGIVLRSTGVPQFNVDSGNSDFIIVDSKFEDVAVLGMVNYRGQKWQIEWLKADGNGNMILSDSDGDRIIVREMDRVFEHGYAFLFEGLFEVRTIRNSTSGFANDDVILEDVFTGENYEASIFQEGRGQIVIGNEEYNVYYWDDQTDNAYVRLDHSDSRGEDGEVAGYYTMETDEFAQMMFFEDVELDLTDFDGLGTQVQQLILPSRKYEIKKFDVELKASGVVNIDGNDLEPGERLFWSGGAVTYVFKNSNNGDYKINYNIYDTVNAENFNPGIVLFESEDDFGDKNALIVKMEGLGNSADAIGVEEVQMTWGDEFKELPMESENNAHVSQDGWGTFILTGSQDLDQKVASIIYNERQAYAETYLIELI